ncbi:geranylgeranylglycerol-phosphate geranylgeranyltransferase [Halobacterium sp. KA-4]|uniref:geranylgeranylglycerol-phosphate geranylgeranyltransferase n=1 Tax=Halobacterium sp. KA-4 TaxID=2896367 RepID=UPI001E5A242C|nr:geranylgeranylglycerol-phosphate geranylgeranyltransferase [Halobacterium sp. KA-4]MCD2200792.1 geranylgeranylglycerol-phosphate geranylgeranyltransferase [Halobacterium sp. KA-4]
MSVAATVRGLVELTRPVNTVAAGALTFIGAFVAGGAFAEPTATAAAVGATWFATAAGMAINDYFDREIDRINNPERAIPRGAVSARGTLVFSLALFAGAMVLALLLPPLALGIAAVNLVALVTYTEYFKGLPGAGNALVAYLVGSTFLFGAAAVGDPLAGGVLAVLAALSTFTREVIKDVEDIEGDREEGLRTLPIVVGERRALVLGTALLIIAVLASPVPYLFGTFGVWYLVVVAPADAVMLAAAYRSFDDPEAGQQLLKAGTFVAAVAFVVGRLVAP